MRRVLVLTGSLALLFTAPAAAQSTASVTSFGLFGKSAGVTATVNEPTLTFSFAGKSRQAMRAFRGRTVRVACEQMVSTNLLDLPPSESRTKKVRVGRHATKLKTRILFASEYDICAAYVIVRKRLYLVVASATTAGEAGLAEAEVAGNIAGAFQLIYALSDQGKAPTPEAAVVRLGTLIVAMPDANSTPPVGQIGYWSDGDKHLVLSAASPFGRRLFFEVEANGALRENITVLLPYALFVN